MFGDRRYRFVLYVALIVAGLATFGVYRVIDGMRASSRIATQSVVIAASDIPEGTQLTSPSLAVVELPVVAVPAGSYSTPDSVVGRVSRIPIFKGEAIVPGRLAPEGTAGGIEVKIPAGKRAMSIRIDDVSGLSGMVQPNSRVDVMLTTGDANGGQISKLFMSNMRVLSIGAQVTRGADGQPINAPTAALEVSPEEAERLALAQREGSIQLVLRGYGDPDSVKTTGARKNMLLGGVSNSAPAPAPAAPPAPRRSTPRPAPAPASAAPATVIQVPEKTDSVTVRVYRGEAVQQLQFEQAKDAARRDSIRKAQQRRDTLAPSPAH